MQQPQNQPERPLPWPPGGNVEGGPGGWTPPRPESSNDGLKLKGDWMKLWFLIFRACALLFSILSFILMVTYYSEFHEQGTLSYVLAIAIITIVYTAVQSGIKGHELLTSQNVMPPKAAIWFDFCGDQLFAYMLLSAAAAGGAVSVAGRNFYGETRGMQLISASTSMSALAFISLAPTALFSAYRLFANI